MRSGEGDVAADGATHEGQDCREEWLDTGGRRDGVLQCIAYRWLDHDDHDEDDHDHDGAEDLCQGVHRGFRVLEEENDDGDGCRDDISDGGRNTEQGVQAQRTAADIADVKDEAAEHDHEGYEVTESRENLIRDILSAKTGRTEYAPDVELCDR